MKALPFTLFIMLFTLQYLSKGLGILPKALTWLPEVAAMVAALLVMMTLALQHRFDVPGKYLAVLFVFTLWVVAGILINSVSTGTIVFGIRYYFPYFAFFFLPIAYSYSDADMLKQLKFLLFLALCQLPVTVFQRFFQYQGVDTGDYISGTMGDTSELSMYLIGVMSILVAFRLRAQITAPRFAWLLFLVFIPTAINETKATLIFLPIALIVPVLMMSGSAAIQVNVRGLVILGVVLSALFLTLYNTFYSEEVHDQGLVSLLASPDAIKRYAYGGAASEDLDSIAAEERPIDLPDEDVDERVGRIDAIIIPFRVLASDPVKLLVGLGIANVSASFFNKFAGAYVRYTHLGSQKTTISQLVWEVGVGGLILSLLLLWMIFQDARALSADNSLKGIFASGWTAVVVMIFLAYPYKNLTTLNQLSYLFWYFSGYVVASRYRLEHRIGASRIPYATNQAALDHGFATSSRRLENGGKGVAGRSGSRYR